MSDNKHELKQSHQDNLYFQAPTLGNLEKLKALLFVALNGCSEVVKWLIKKDIGKIEERDSQGLTTFLAAISEGHLDMAKGLLKNGAKISECDMYGFSALHHAVRGDHLETIKFLVEEQGVDLQQRSHANSGAVTAYLIAIERASLEVIQYLLQHGANVKDCDREGRSALMIAIRFKRLDVMRFLLSETEVDIHWRDNQGSTALLTAFWNLENREALSEILITQYGANPHDKDYSGQTLSDTFRERVPDSISGDSEKLKAVYQKYFIKQDEKRKLALKDALSELMISDLQGIVYSYANVLAPGELSYLNEPQEPMASVAEVEQERPVADFARLNPAPSPRSQGEVVPGLEASSVTTKSSRG